MDTPQENRKELIQGFFSLSEPAFGKAWLDSNPGAKASVERGLQQAAAGELCDLGSFTQFIDLEEDASGAITLSGSARDSFLADLKNPPEPTTALADGMKDYWKALNEKNENQSWRAWQE